MLLVAKEPNPPDPRTQVWRIHDACPGEGGCVFGPWTVKGPVTAYEKRPPAQSASFTLKKGDKVAGLRSTLVSLATGVCTAKQDLIATRVKTSQEIPIPRGTVIATFYEEGEAYVTGAIGAQWTPADRISVCCIGSSLDCSKPPVYELWLKFRTADGREGWSKDVTQFNGASRYDE